MWIDWLYLICTIQFEQLLRSLLVFLCQENKSSPYLGYWMTHIHALKPAAHGWEVDHECTQQFELRHWFAKQWKNLFLVFENTLYTNYSLNILGDLCVFFSWFVTRMMWMIQMVQRGELSTPFHRCGTHRYTQDFQDFLRVRLALANEYKATKTNAENKKQKETWENELVLIKRRYRTSAGNFQKNMILTSEKNERIKPITITYQHTDNFTDSV